MGEVRATPPAPPARRPVRVRGPAAAAGPRPAIAAGTPGRQPTGRPPRRTRFSRWSSVVLSIVASFQAGVLAMLLWTSVRPAGDEVAARAPAAIPDSPVDLTARPPPTRPAEPAPPPLATAVPSDAGVPAPAPAVRPRKDARPRPAPKPAPPPVSPAELVEVEVSSEPAGATVKVGGVVYGMTPLTAFLPAGRRTVITFELSGHAPIRMSWGPGGRPSVRATLTAKENP